MIGCNAHTPHILIQLDICEILNIEFFKVLWEEE